MHAKNAGFTLTEVSLGVAVVGILTVATVPNIRSYVESRRSSDASNQVEMHLRMARSRAVMEGNTYFIQFQDNNTYVVVDDDGGGQGIPGAAGFVAANRSNLLPDAGERVYGPFDLPEGIVFDAASGSVNPFTGNATGDAVTFPQVNGGAMIVFNPDGTTNNTGYIALAPMHAIAAGTVEKARTLRVLRSTGNVSVRQSVTTAMAGG